MLFYACLRKEYIQAVEGKLIVEADPDVATGIIDILHFFPEARRHVPQPGQDFVTRFGKVKQATKFRHEGENVSKVQGLLVKGICLD